MRRAILCYLPEPRPSTQAFLRHIAQFTTTVPVIFYSHYNYPDVAVESVPGPILMKMGSLPPFHRPSTQFCLHAFVEGVKLAERHSLDDYIYIEDDCYVTRDNWDSYLWAEWDGSQNKVVAGCPVVLNMHNASSQWVRRCVDYLAKYHADSNLPAAFEIGGDNADFQWGQGGYLFPNGGLSMFNVQYIRQAFDPVVMGYVKSFINFVPFDFAIGKVLRASFGVDIFEHLLPLTSIYSGCGDHHIDEVGRRALVRLGRHVGIHKWHFA